MAANAALYAIRRSGCSFKVIENELFSGILFVLSLGQSDPFVSVCKRLSPGSALSYIQSSIHPRNTPFVVFFKNPFRCTQAGCCMDAVWILAGKSVRSVSNKQEHGQATPTQSPLKGHLKALVLPVMSGCKKGNKVQQGGL